MKLSFLGKYIIADFGVRVASKALDIRKCRARVREQEPQYGWEPYTRAEAAYLIRTIFDCPTFETRWQQDPSEACRWAIQMDPSEFFRTFKVAKFLPGTLELKSL